MPSRRSRAEGERASSAAGDSTRAGALKRTARLTKGLPMKLPIPAMLVVLFCAAMCSAAGRAELKTGKADLRSAGPLVFGPDGILFAGDSAGGAVFAIDTGDRKPASGGSIEIKGINEKVA